MSSPTPAVHPQGRPPSLGPTPSLLCPKDEGRLCSPPLPTVHSWPPTSCRKEEGLPPASVQISDDVPTLSLSALPGSWALFIPWLHTHPCRVVEVSAFTEPDPEHGLSLAPPFCTQHLGCSAKWSWGSSLTAGTPE